MKKSYLIAGILTFTLLLFLAIYFSLHKEKTAQVEGIEHGSQTAVSIDNAAQLNDYLLAEQYNSVIKELQYYIPLNIKKNAVSAKIVPGSTKLNDDGSIQFFFTVDDGSIKYEVDIQKPNPYTIVLKIPRTNYTSTIRPYSNDSDNPNE